tara:strand:+ start:1754 stop:1993 length:240 start_codon:yes stop_codon:yes gene_type:complete
MTTNDKLEINTIDIKVITKDSHLGIRKRSLTLPVIVQSAMAIIIEAKKSINISFKLHIINTDIIKAVTESKLVGFNLNF